MKFVLLVYQGSTPLPGSDRWQALSDEEQKAIYADYAELNKTAGIAPGLPLGLPDAARTVQVVEGKTHVKNGTYLPEGAAGYAVYEAENIDAAIAREEARALAIVDGIERGEFPPRPAQRSLCTTCSWAGVCRKDYVDVDEPTTAV